MSESRLAESVAVVKGGKRDRCGVQHRCQPTLVSTLRGGVEHTASARRTVGGDYNRFSVWIVVDCAGVGKEMLGVHLSSVARTLTDRSRAA